MNYIIWIFAGAVLGGLASLVIRRRSAILLNIIVGMVGAFVAGYLLSPVFRVNPTNQGIFSPLALMISVVGAVFLLVVVNFTHRKDHVNNEVIERKWEQVRGKIHTRWGKLTEEDVVKIDGNHNRFIATLQTRYGCAKEAAEDQIQRYLKSALVDSGRPIEYDRAQVADPLPVVVTHKP